MKKILLTMCFVWVALAGAGAATYTWKGGPSGAWSTSTNWNPERTTPATTDILVFDLGNRDGANTAGDVNVSDVSNETIGQLQIVRATGSSTGFKILTMSGTTTTLTITGDLVIGFYASGTNCRLTDGGNTIKVGGNFTTVSNQTHSAIYHTGSGKIVFTSASATLASGATGGNITFQNVDIGDGLNTANLTIGGAFLIKGNLYISTNATLTQNAKSLILESTTGIGGTISGSGNIIFTGSGGVLYIQGTAGAVEQNVGTMNLNTVSEANSTINSIQFLRPNSVFTFGTAYNNNVVVNGSIRIDAGIFDDGGNAVIVKGGTILDVNPTVGSGTGIHRGTGKIVAARTAASPLLVRAGKTLTIGNLEIGSASGAVTYAVGSGTNLTINGTLTLSKAGSVINASGSNITFQNAGVPIALTAGTITTDANTNINFGSTGNTGGAAFSIPNNLFTSAPTVGTINISRDNPLTFNNQALTATSININAGSKLSLGAALSATNLNIKSNAGNGTATLVDNGYTVTATNSNIEQYLSSSRNFYISSPVTGATAGSGPQYWNYTEAGNDGLTWTPLSSGFTYSVGKGYVVRPASASTYTFTGAINTGNKSITGLTSTATAKSGFNLVGNPYPSYVRWSEIAKTNVSNTMWYRTHDGSAWRFWTYNTVDGRGGISVPATVTDYIPPMQAFWVKVDAGETGELSFDNSKRYHQDVTGNAFRAPSNQTPWQSFVRLQLSNGNFVDEAVIYMHENASDAFDRYDSEKLFIANDQMPEIYTQAGDSRLVINGLNVSHSEKLLPLGINAGVAGTYTIKASELKLNNDEATVYLRDNLTGNETQLQEGASVQFNTNEPLNGTSRFEVLFRVPSGTTAVAGNDFHNINITNPHAGRIVVSNAPTGSEVLVLTFSGQRVYTGTITGYVQMLNYDFGNGAYLIKISSESKSITSKLIIQ